jgi:hypothetical protein
MLYSMQMPVNGGSAGCQPKIDDEDLQDRKREAYRLRNVTCTRWSGLRGRPCRELAVVGVQFRFTTTTASHRWTRPHFDINYLIKPITLVQPRPYHLVLQSQWPSPPERSGWSYSYYQFAASVHIYSTITTQVIPLDVS